MKWAISYSDETLSDFTTERQTAEEAHDDGQSSIRNDCYVGLPYDGLLRNTTKHSSEVGF